MRLSIPWFTREPTPRDAGSYRAEPSPAEMTRAANAESILAIPLSILPDGPARRLALAEAASGKDVYAYQGTPHHANRWYLWYGPLAAADPLAHDGRIPAQHWAANWDMILLGMARGSLGGDGTGEGWQRAMRKGGAA